MSFECSQKKIENQKIVQVNKNIENKNSDGNFIGMAKFSKNIKDSLYQNIKELIKNGNHDAYYTLALESMIKHGQPIHFIETDGHPWMDIDTKEELEEAKKIEREFVG